MNHKLLIILLLTCTLLCEGIVELISIHENESISLDLTSEGEEEKDIEEKSEQDSKVKVDLSGSILHLVKDATLSSFEFSHPVHTSYLDVLIQPPQGPAISA